MSDQSELANVASTITDSALAPSSTIASDNFDSTKRKRSHKRSRVSIDEEPIEDDIHQVNANYAQMGTVMAACFFSLCTVIGGPDWQPESSEKTAMEQAWAGYFEARGIQQLSPELMLAIVIAGYSGKRLMMPTTQSRLKTIWNRIRNARANRGNYNQWQNNTGAQTSDAGTVETSSGPSV